MKVLFKADLDSCFWFTQSSSSPPPFPHPLLPFTSLYLFIHCDAVIGLCCFFAGLFWVEAKLHLVLLGCDEGADTFLLHVLLPVGLVSGVVVLQIFNTDLCSRSVPQNNHRSFSYAAPAVWNALPWEIRSSNTISSFKSSLITYLFQQSN